MKTIIGLCGCLLAFVSSTVQAQNLSEHCAASLLQKHIFIGSEINAQASRKEAELAAAADRLTKANGRQAEYNESAPIFSAQLLGKTLGSREWPSRLRELAEDSRSSAKGIAIAEFKGERALTKFVDELSSGIKGEKSRETPSDAAREPQQETQTLETSPIRIAVNALGGAGGGLALCFSQGGGGVLTYVAYGVGGCAFGLATMVGTNVSTQSSIPAIEAWSEEVRGSLRSGKTHSETDFALWAMEMSDGSQVDLLYVPKTNDSVPVIYLVMREQGLQMP